jgi:hypothetical protein
MRQRFMRAQARQNKDKTIRPWPIAATIASCKKYPFGSNPHKRIFNAA